MIGPSTGTFSDPANGGAGHDGDGNASTVNGLCANGFPSPSTFFTCDEANEPGVPIRITCCGGDGDEDCDKCKFHDIQCPGANLCAGVDCSDGVECTEDNCDPVSGNCSNPPVASGVDCTAAGGGPGTCDGAGACVPSGCVDDSECETADPCTTSTCDVGSGSCNPVVDLSLIHI